MATYDQPDGSPDGTRYYQDVEISPTTLADGSLLERLGSKKYPQRGLRSETSAASIVLTVEPGLSEPNDTPLTLVCTVTASAAPAPSGNVRFYDGEVFLGEAPLRTEDDSLATLASATVATATLSGVLLSDGGTHALAAAYAGSLTDAESNEVDELLGVAPVITSASSTTFIAGEVGTFTVTTTGDPTPGLSELGALPAGVTFTDEGDGTATIEGTPTESGEFDVALTAANEIEPDAEQALTLVVNEAPAFTSANNTTFTDGAPGTFTVAVTGFPVPDLSETGALPSGITFVDNGDGTATIEGTHTGATVAAITLTATNGVGDPVDQGFTLTVS